MTGNLDIKLMGKRCHLEGHKGTVRFIGHVTPHEGSWYGIEWDTERGKHDGTAKDGKQYFKCRKNYGSFVRPNKLSFGRDVIDALNINYGSGSFDETANRMILHKDTKQETFVEMVGFDKIARMQSNFSKLRVIELSGLFISHAHEVNNLADSAPNLTSLSLRDNLLSSLVDIIDIAGSLKKLESLDISENLINDFNIENETMENFPKLQSVYANRMNLSWNDVLKIIKLSININEVYVCYNEINTLSYNEQLNRIKVLNLEGNFVTSWEEVTKLSKMQQLESLILNYNTIKKMKFDETGVDFPNLISLSLWGIGLESWNSINQLNHLKKFEILKIKDNPISEGMTSFAARQQLISRLVNLKTCNLSKVATEERKKAELAYLKIYREDYNMSKHRNQINQFLVEHPRYLQLVDSFGEPIEDKKPNHLLKDNLLELVFECPDDSSKVVKTKSVPATMTVQQLKGMLQRFYKVPSSKQKITYRDEKNEREIEMNDNMRQLLFYSVKSGDVVLLRWER